MPPRKKQRIDGDVLLPVAVAPRRTTRASTKAARAGGIIVAEDPPVVANRKAKVKMAQDTSKRVFRKGGLLQTLPDLALDVQLEIYNYLDVVDLYNLARTSKRFRAFFLDKMLEKKLWVPARANTLGIPKPPPFMPSEYSFVHLLLSPHCHNCGTSSVRQILNGCLARLCTTCLLERTIECDEAYDKARKISKALADALFNTYTVSNYFPVQRYSMQRTFDPKCNRLLKGHVNRVLRQYKALPKPMTAEALMLFVEQVQADYTDRFPYINAVRAWMDEQEEQRLARLEEARQRRFQDILVRLRGTGWEKDVDFMREGELEIMSNLPVVRQSSKLTEGAWQKVLVALDGFLKDIREDRLNFELRKTLAARFRALDEALVAHYVTLPRTARMDCRPQYIDLAFTPECRAIVDVPMSQTVTADDFAAIIPALAQKWDADRRQELTEYLLPHLGDIAADVDPLELAISFFDRPDTRMTGRLCAGAISTMRYPAILNHDRTAGPTDGCYRTSSYTVDEFREEDTYTRTTKTLYHLVEFESQILELNGGDMWLNTHVPFKLNTEGRHPDVTEAAVGRMRRIVQMVGLDPARATIEDLERCNVWFRCISCETDRPDEPIFVRSWSGVYNHELVHITGTGLVCHAPRSSELPQWLRADADVMNVVRAYQEAELSQTNIYGCEWSCSLCPTFDTQSDSMAMHLEETHGGLDFCAARRDGVIYVSPRADKSLAFTNTLCLREAIRQG